MAQVRVLALYEVQTERLALDTERARLEGVAQQLQSQEAALLSWRQAQENRLEVSVAATEGKLQELQAQHGLELTALREKLLMVLEAQRVGGAQHPSKARLRPLKPVRAIRGQW